MSERIEGHCETCAWWASNMYLTNGQSQCRRRAPMQQGNAWPITSEDDWCGEWESEKRWTTDAGER